MTEFVTASTHRDLSDRLLLGRQVEELRTIAGLTRVALDLDAGWKRPHPLAFTPWCCEQSAKSVDHPVSRMDSPPRRRPQYPIK